MGADKLIVTPCSAENEKIETDNKNDENAAVAYTFSLYVMFRLHNEAG